jgi:two-component system, OmpR family, sensor kinase
MKSRLWLRVYLGTVVALVALFAFTVLFSRLSDGDRLRETELWSGRMFSELARNRADPAALEASLAWMRELKSLGVTLYDEGGALVASSEPEPPGRLEPEVLARVQRGGAERLGWAQTLVPVTLPDGKVGVGKVAYLGATATPTLIWLGADLLLMLGLALLFTRHLVKPLQRIGGAATRFGKGELGARSGVERSDEIGDVARAFDDTADRVNTLMTAQRELIANVSHELRTPLARMRVALDLIADGMADQTRDVVPEITADLEELERLLEDVMTVARLDLAESRDGKSLTPLRREPTRPQDLVARAAERFRSQHPGRALEVKIVEPVAQLELDPVLMRRVIDNLIDNARKYSDAAIAVDLGPKNGGVAVTVRDRGIGMDPGDLQKVFTPFFRADQSRTRATGGVGLGLVLARRVVEAHGGTIQIDSALGRGTAVSFELPLTSSSPPA